MRAFLLALSATLASALATGASAQPAASAPAAPPPRSCFFVSQFENWKAPDENTIYIRVNLSKYYRLDLANKCPMLLWPDAHLVMNVRGPDTICSAIDWDLKVNDSMHSGPVPCIVKTMTPLTPEQAAAIPPKFKP